VRASVEMLERLDLTNVFEFIGAHEPLLESLAGPVSVVFLVLALEDFGEGALAFFADHTILFFFKIN
jgi:hypothetical protein